MILSASIILKTWLWRNVGLGYSRVLGLSSLEWDSEVQPESCSIPHLINNSNFGNLASCLMHVGCFSYLK
jgi:hypothetical protein